MVIIVATLLIVLSTAFSYWASRLAYRSYIPGEPSNFFFGVILNLLFVLFILSVILETPREYRYDRRDFVFIALISVVIQLMAALGSLFEVLMDMMLDCIYSVSKYIYTSIKRYRNR